MKIVFLHGWSFDASIWSAVQDALACPDMSVLDQGQTGNVVRMTLPDSPFLAVGHSAGALWFLDRDLPWCRGLIAINGFSRFAQAKDFPFGIAPRLIYRMQRQLAHDASDVVTTFRKQIAAEYPLPETCSTVPLHENLSLLLNGEGRPRARALGSRLVSIEGKDDPLLSNSIRAACFSCGPRLILPAGHLLPITHAEDCASVIRKALEDAS